MTGEEAQQLIDEAKAALEHQARTDKTLSHGRISDRKCFVAMYIHEKMGMPMSYSDSIGKVLAALKQPQQEASTAK